MKLQPTANGKVFFGDFIFGMNETYGIKRTCIKCSHAEGLALSKREFVFGLGGHRNTLGPKCKNCGGDKFEVCLEPPDFDLELLKEWAGDTELYVMEQDEDIILGEGENLEIILEVLDNVGMHDYKRNVLMSALCVIVYDNSVEDGDDYEPDEALKRRVIGELNKRTDKLKLAAEWIMPYIKEVVYPQLDFE